MNLAFCQRFILELDETLSLLLQIEMADLIEIMDPILQLTPMIPLCIQSLASKQKHAHADISSYNWSVVVDDILNVIYSKNYLDNTAHVRETMALTFIPSTSTASIR
jgi:hypothetical protein